MKHIYVLFLLAVVACDNSNTTYSRKESNNYDTINHEASMPLQEEDLIDSLYNGKIIFKGLLVDSFGSSYTYDRYKKEIKAEYTASVGKHNFGYILHLKDTSDIYNSEQFEPSVNFKYIGSKLFLDETIIDISNLRYVNANEFVEPVIVWYGKSFGIAAKYYELSNSDIFLIRGINYDCNGSNCMNYKVLVIKKDKNNGKVSASVIDFPGNFPYSFETTFLFSIKGDPVPKLYIIKDGKTGMQVSDFQVYNIR